jgi:hypothetical protein
MAFITEFVESDSDTLPMYPESDTLPVGSDLAAEFVESYYVPGARLPASGWMGHNKWSTVDFSSRTDETFDRMRETHEDLLERLKVLQGMLAAAIERQALETTEEVARLRRGQPAKQQDHDANDGKEEADEGVPMAEKTRSASE